MADEKTYRVSGTQPVRTDPNARSDDAAHQPGETFKAELDPVQEQRLVNSGVLEVVAPGFKRSSAPSSPEE